MLEIFNDSLSVMIVPQLGAKIVSLRNKITGRQWCWHPGDHLELFRNDYGDPFEKSPHAGVDECFPTVGECSVKGRDLPCHGEVWAEPWEVDKSEWRKGVILTRVTPRRSPFTLTRRLSLQENRIHLDYSLRNRGSEPESFLWSLHPLLRLTSGDRVELPPQVRELNIECAHGAPDGREEAIWPWPAPFTGFQLDRFELGKNPGCRFKGFTEALSEGWARIRNENSGDTLKVCWNVEQNPFLGVWMTRGGYRGFHDVAALEPTNAPTDFLSKVPPNDLSVLLPGNVRNWSVALELNN